MKKNRPLGIRQTIWLAASLAVLSIVLGASALYRYQRYRDSRDAERLRAVGIAQTYAAQVGPLLVAGSPDEARSLIEKIAWHSDSCMLALLDARDRPVAVRGSTGLLDWYLNLPEAESANQKGGSWNIPPEPEHRRPELALAVVPIRVPNAKGPSGVMVYAARASRGLGVTPESIWKFFFNLLLISVVGMMLGFLWLKQKVLAPLAALARQSTEQASGVAAACGFADRQDEIGELARALTEMHVDLEEWRSRAARLERSMDDRVAAETRKITRELRQMEKQIWTDPLTRLGNRRMFDEKFAEIFEAQKRADQDLALVVMDVDYFKTLNDTLGHKAGDRLLTLIGDLLKQCLREQDLAIRYGGDEFLLILPSVSAPEAQIIAERTLRLFAQQTKTLGVSPQPTMSAGIASVRQHRPATPAELFEIADHAVYQAKKAGKSQTCIYRASRTAILR